MKQSEVQVGVLMGSDSDWPLMEETVKTLQGFEVPCEVRVLSAHRTPDLAALYAKQAADRGLKVIIAAAGGSAHLAGVIAAHTTLPVIGVPVAGGALDGLDALLATVQMPGGIPVATVAIGRGGAVNAAVLAVQILAVARPELQPRLLAHKQSLMRAVEAGDARVQVEAAKIRATAAGP
jgi:5-(carboxyamino)imidazole ribonucleotide mutase